MPNAKDGDAHNTPISAVIFDLDGVLTDTARVHAAAWKRLFDELLKAHSERTGASFQAFDIDEDYWRYVDGKPRYDGVEAFLAARGISLPYGDPADHPGGGTVCGLGNLKNVYFLDALRTQGGTAVPAARAVLERLTDLNVAIAVVSASKNARRALEVSGLADLVHEVVDGMAAEERGLAGKPDPATFLEASRRLGVDASRAAVVEDSRAGVEAGRRGGFRLVVGMDRAGQPDALLRAGADTVIGRLDELLTLVAGRGRERWTPGR